MKTITPIRLILIIMIVCIVCALFACKVTKESTVTKTFDDTTIRHLRDSFSLVITKKDEMHLKEMEEVRKSRVEFNETPCPPQRLIDSNCNKDSLVHIIRDLEAYNNTAINSIEYYKDGSYKATGRIKSVQNELSNSKKELEFLSQKYEGLQVEHNDSLVSFKHYREETEKKLKSKPGGIFQAWWLFPLGLILGVVGYRYFIKKKNIFSNQNQN